MADAIKNPVFRILVYGHVLLALGAAAQVWWIGSRFLVVANLRLMLLAGFGTLGAYGAMRLSRMSDPEVRGSAMLAWYQRNARALVVAVVLCGIVAIGLALPFWRAVLSVLWKPGVLVALYILPAVLTKGRSTGLRNIPFLKAFLIAFVWAAVTALLPDVTSAVGEEQATTGVRWIFVVQFCFFLSLAIAFDVRDLPYDPPKLRTVPQILGVRGAKFVALLLLMPMTFLLILMSWMLHAPSSTGADTGIDLAYAMPLLGVVMLGIAIVCSDGARPWWYFPILMDGSLVLIPLLSWIGGALQ